MNVILAGGGTAGHVNPAISIAKAIVAASPDSKVLFIGNEGSLEEKLTKNAGFDIRFIRVEGLRRSLSPKNVRTARLFFKAVGDCKRIIKEFGAQAVIGTGGYVSGPAVYAAHALGVPTCIHEQNAYPGVTSKFLSRYADRVFISFDGSQKYFPKAKKIILSGNPLDEAFMFPDRERSRKKLGIPEDAFYVLSFAGSLGAREFNKLFIDFILKNAQRGDFYHTHATGSFGWTWMPDELKKAGFEGADGIELKEYVYDMPDRLAACDLVISRAGAITLGEITACGKPSILIPSPNVTHNHQYHNAMSLVSAGAALILEEKDATCEKLYSMALGVKNDGALARSLAENSQGQARLNAAQVIVRELFEITK